MRLPAEKRSWGPLIATIDLMFLLLCFFLLLLFYQAKGEARTQAQLESAQQTLSRVTGEETRDVSSALQALEPVLRTFMVQQRKEAERQRELAAREERRLSRPLVKVNYEILPGGRVVYEQRPYSVAEFRTQVVGRLRGDSWVALRAMARPETPFGEVVASRRVLLENSGEFDTYWDNVTPQKPEAEARPR